MKGKNVYRKVLDKVKQVEDGGQSLENFVKSTYFDDKHKLRIKEANASEFQNMAQIYEDLTDLEIADLLDYQNLMGRFDGDNSKTW